jgi:uncharacterized protein involved in exopolysaccharide biosynthesis
MQKTTSILSRTPPDYRMPDRISLHAVGRVLRYEWRFIAACALLFVVVGGLYCAVTKPKYEASIEIVPGDFTTKSTATGGNIAGLASLVLNANPQSDAVKRFLTVLYSPDLARRLANDDEVLRALNARGKLGRLAKLLGQKEEPLDYPRKVRLVEGALSKIEFEDSKKTLATELRYQSTDRQSTLDFLRLATKQGDEILRQYNLSEIAFDDVFLNRSIADAQNVDVKLALAQNLVQTELRKMEANRSEYFSIRTLGPVEAPLEPIWPKWNYVVGGMFLLGSLIGVLFAFVRIYARSELSIDDRR